MVLWFSQNSLEWSPAEHRNPWQTSSNPSHQKEWLKLPKKRRQEPKWISLSHVNTLLQLCRSCCHSLLPLAVVPAAPNLKCHFRGDAEEFVPAVLAQEVWPGHISDFCVWRSTELLAGAVDAFPWAGGRRSWLRKMCWRCSAAAPEDGELCPSPALGKKQLHHSGSRCSPTWTTPALPKKNEINFAKT